MIRLDNVSKYYYKNGIVASGISKINLKLEMGEFVAITGESGSGKSTLLNVISGLDTYEEGEMYINGSETSHFTGEDFLEFRRKYVSNIYQTFNLVNSYTVYQNIELSLLLNGKKSNKETKKEIIELIKQVDLYKFRNTKISKLSGGMKQRVAIARALASHTPIIIADEPTGNLDAKSAKKIIELLTEIAKDKLVIVVTHNFDQIKDNTTRVIKMHDGKILEDRVLDKEKKEIDIRVNEVHNIRFFNKIKLGIRNAFNILPKTLLMILVYLFIVAALMSEYSAFKKQEYDSSIMGYNSYFQDTSDKRIVIKKSNNESITEDDYQALNALSNISYVVKNDLLLDSSISLSDKDFYFYLWGPATAYNNYDLGVDIGRLPEKANEILLYGSKNDYYIGFASDEIMKTNFYMQNESNGELDLSNPLQVVGIKYTDNNAYINTKIILQEEMMEKIKFSINEKYSTLKVLFNNEYYNSNYYDNYFKIVPNSNVARGKVFVSNDLSYGCKKETCINYPLDIEVSNIYYNDKLTLSVSNMYTKNNFKKMTGLDNFDNYNGVIFVNVDDYNSLFEKNYYQSSVFVKDVNNLEETTKKLNDLGYKTLVIKDTLVSSGEVEILQIVRTIVTIILVVALFFISYFVIKIILKSRQVYFSTIRMLGSTRKVSTNLLVIELLTISNLTYFIFMLFVYLNYCEIYQVSIFNTIINYLKVSDYVILYLIITFISVMISLRFASNIFKKSMITSINEEV